MVAPKAEAPASAIRGAMEIPKLPSVIIASTVRIKILTALPIKRDRVTSMPLASQTA